jgi:hypothetical protein
MQQFISWDSLETPPQQVKSKASVLLYFYTILFKYGMLCLSWCHWPMVKSTTSSDRLWAESASFGADGAPSALVLLPWQPFNGLVRLTSRRGHELGVVL